MSPEELTDCFKCHLNDPLETELPHNIVQYNAPDGTLLICLCRECKLGTTQSVCRGYWQYNIPGVPVMDVAVKLFFQTVSNDNCIPLIDQQQAIEREVRGMKSVYDGPAGLAIVAHAFNWRHPTEGCMYHFVATTLAQSTVVAQVFECELDDPLRLHMAQALLREANLLLDRDVIHGDIKPENILTSKVNGVWKVSFCDFEFSSVPTRTGATRGHGTPQWTSPEQRDTGKLSHANDQWSMALVLYEIMHQTNTTAPIFWEHHDKKSSSGGEVAIQATVNPWLRVVMKQLFAGKRYDGLMKFDHAELREAVWVLSEGLKTKSLEEVEIWQRLKATLEKKEPFLSYIASHPKHQPFQPLHDVRNDIVHGNLPVAALYHNTKPDVGCEYPSDKRPDHDSTAILASLDEALLEAGLRVVKNEIGQLELQ